jgi:glycosyltransferase involved in cell wall biosynthesis
MSETRHPHRRTREPGSDRLDILYVGTLPPHPGGSAVSCGQLLGGLARRGHAVRALAPITAEALRAGDPFAASHPEVRVSRFLVPWFETASDVPPASDYRATEGARIRDTFGGLIASERPDIVFIGRETYAWHVPELALAHGLPSILRIAGGSTQGILRGTYSAELSARLLAQYRQVDLVVAQARHMAESLRRLGVDRVAIIPNALDLQQFAPGPRSPALLRQLEIPDDAIVAVHASNLKPLKRALDIVHSAERALRADPRLVYVIVGDGPCRAAMETACRDRRIAARFRFVGWVDYPRVPDYIRLADIFLLPSDDEHQARVSLETQACARLLLASDIPGVREVVEDGETGLLFRPGDIEELTAQTLRAAADPQLRADIGRKAAERVVTHSLDDALDAYLAALRAVIREHREA